MCIRDSQLGVAYTKLGVVNRRKGEHVTAIDYYLKAKKVFEKNKDTTNMADVIHNMALVYRYQKQYDKSLKDFKLAIRLNEKTKDTFSTAMGYSMIGIVYRRLKQPDSAFVSYQKAKKLFTILKIEEEITGVNANIAVLYQSLKRYDAVSYTHLHRDKGYGVVVMTNSTFPEFNAEVMRAVAQTYGWDNYVPVHQKEQIEQSLVNDITGRYQSDDVIVEIYQKNDELFYKNILSEEGTELVKVSDSLFVRRNSSRFIQFKPNVQNGILHLQYLNRNNGTIISFLTKVMNDQKKPVEFLLEGDLENALIAYKNLKKYNPTHPMVTESYINDMGYDFFHEDRMILALNTFKVNIILYPKSFKAYESYARACAKVGETDLAISNYLKSLELNPQNNEARHRLKELQKSE